MVSTYRLTMGDGRRTPPDIGATLAPDRKNVDRFTILGDDAIRPPVDNEHPEISRSAPNGTPTVLFLPGGSLPLTTNHDIGGLNVAIES